MASSLSAYMRHTILEHCFRAQPWTPPTTVYFSLHSANPGLTGAHEIAGAVRQPISWAEAVDNLMTTNAALSVPNMPSSVVAAVGIWDAEVNGHFMWGGDTTNKTVNTGDEANLGAGDLTVEIT